jgi:ribosomal protein S18 acetylase RimI-like enzyme
MPHLHSIKSQVSPYWDSLVRIYRESFPLDEQRPVESIVRLIEHEPRYTLYAIINEKPKVAGHREKQRLTFNDNTEVHPQLSSFIFPLSTKHTLGLLTTWHFEEFIYIEHFAIDPTLRSQGYGSEALKAFIHEHGKPIVLEAEPPTDALSIRRIKFYERIGLTLYDFPYMQPAYTEDSHPVELRLMGTLDTETTPLPLVSQILHREVYGWTAND